MNEGLKHKAIELKGKIEQQDMIMWMVAKKGGKKGRFIRLTFLVKTEIV